MGIEQPPKYYDDIFATSQAYNDPAPGEPGGLWERIAHTALNTERQTIYDFGCGPGQICQILYRDGFTGFYRGVDFSTVAVNNAKQRNMKSLNASFTVADITTMDVGEFITDPHHSTIISTEFLEHVHNDLEFMAAIPAGVRLVLTVPTFDDPGHVRCFPTTEEVVARYGPYIDNLELLFLPEDKCYIFAGTKKETQ